MKPTKADRCPEDGGEFVEYQTRYGLLLECSTCTVRQWFTPSGRPKGTPANIFLRTYRKRAHVAFQRLYSAPNAPFSRRDAYRWLFEALGQARVRFGELTTLECDRVVKLCDARWLEAERRRAERAQLQLHAREKSLRFGERYGLKGKALTRVLRSSPSAKRQR